MESPISDEVCGQWSDLPKDLLELIEEQLLLYKDKLQLSFACVAWRYALPRMPSLKCGQLPGLLLPDNDATETFKFLNLQDKKFYHLELPEARGKLFRGSSNGWLVTVEDSPSMYLINPFTRARVQLPPRSKFPDIKNFQADRVGSEYEVWERNSDEYYYSSPRTIKTHLTYKVIVSSGPNSSIDDCVAVALYGENKRLAYCKPGDEKWTFLYGDKRAHSDIIFHNSQLYALDSRGEVYIFDKIEPSPIVTTLVPPVNGGIRRFPAILCSDLYLMAYSEGVVIVERGVGFASRAEDSPVRTFWFDVFKLERDGATCRWQQVTDIGGYALFVGANNSFSLPSHELQGCKGNCIYFTDDNYDVHTEGVVGGLDVGVYSLETKTIERLTDCTGKPVTDCVAKSRLLWPPPIWVIPSF